MIIGIAGRAQHGKDTIGQVLVARYGYQHAAFADKVRELALVINPTVVHDMNGKMMFSRLSDLVEVYGWNGAKKLPEVRRLLQSIGEGARQVLGDDVWINALFATIDPNANYVITDVRYQNEVDAIRNRGGVVWRVVRPGFDNGVDANHPSERNVALLDVDVDITNDGSVEELQAKVVRLMDGATTNSAVTTTDWIAVTDRMPSSDLVQFTDGTTYHVGYHYYGNYWHDYIKDENYVIGVTHWAELPTLPILKI